MKILLIRSFTVFVLSNCFVSISKAQDHSNMDHTKMSHSKKEGHSHKEDEKHKAEILQTAKDKVIIKVKGMVCDFCAQGIEKTFNKRGEVKETLVDLKKMQVTVTLNKGKTLSRKVIAQIITDSGFKFVDMK